MYKPKYNVGDDVFILKNAQIEERRINSINIKINYEEDVTITYTLIGPSPSGSMYEHQIFKSKQDLLNSL